MKRKVDWTAVTAAVATVALVFSAIGAFYAGAEISTAKKIAKLEFLRAYYQQCQDFNPEQQKLSDGGDWHGPGKGPVTPSDWFRVERYMGLLEQLDVWYHDGILDVESLDRSYAHRIKALATHPWIRKRCLETESFRWQAFIDLTNVLQDAPIYRKLPEGHNDMPAGAGDDRE